MKVTKPLLHFILVLGLCAFTAGLQAQYNMWTWIDGSNFSNQPGIYGTQGVPASGNKPGGRSNATSWTDSTGNLWMFGGRRYTNTSYHNDVWKYDTDINQWAWMKGISSGSSTSGTYGTQGQANASNTPSSRAYMTSAADSVGNLWMFGGRGISGLHNDLWKYNTSTNEWTWVSGGNTTNQSGVYGTQGTASTSNKPGARSGSVSWVDDQGNFWLFGGSSGLQTQYFNDLWKFNPNTNEWTWVKGSNTLNQTSVFGSQGTSAPSYHPGARRYATAWKTDDGKLWLFGGYGYGGTGAGELADLWRYDPSTNNWAYMKGNQYYGSGGISGTKGVTSSSSFPRCRYAACGSMDSNGNLWLFSGATGYQFSRLNDVWMYNPSSNNWTWYNGSQSGGQAGVYYQLGVPNLTAHPGCRDGAVSWSDPDGSMWVFGGYEHYNGAIRDFWRYTNSCNLGIEEANVSDVDCYGGTNGSVHVDVENTYGSVSYTWSNASTGTNNSGLAAGVYTITITDNIGCDYEESFIISEPDEIEISLDTTHESCAGHSDGVISALVGGGISPYAYQWSNSQQTTAINGLVAGIYVLSIIDDHDCIMIDSAEVFVENENPVPDLGSDTSLTFPPLMLHPGLFSNYVWQDGSSADTFVVDSSGTYYVSVENVFGCSASDTIIVTIAPLGLTRVSKKEVHLFPNPTSNQITIEGLDESIEVYNVYLTNINGQIVQSWHLKNRSDRFSLNLKTHSTGLYFLHIEQSKETLVLKILIE